jgi:hypothetical protein
MNSKTKQILGYNYLDNLITGIILGTVAIILVYYIQVKFYGIASLGEYSEAFRVPFLKRSLLGGLAVFLGFNYFDKLYAMRGVLFAIILFGIYLVVKMFF